MRLVRIMAFTVERTAHTSKLASLLDDDDDDDHDVDDFSFFFLLFLNDYDDERIWLSVQKGCLDDDGDDEQNQLILVVIIYHLRLGIF